MSAEMMVGAALLVGMAMLVVAMQRQEQRSVNALQARAARWALRMFGSGSVASAEERALRVMEEAIELGQACGVSRAHATELIRRVYAKPVGEVGQELAGVFVTAYVCAEGLGGNALDLTLTELARIEGLPESVVHLRQASKVVPTSVVARI